MERSTRPTSSSIGKARFTRFGSRSRCFNRLVGGRWFSLDLSLGQSEHQAILRDGIRLDARVAVREEVRNVKVVIYDFAADLVGSLTIPVRR